MKFQLLNVAYDNLTVGEALDQGMRLAASGKKSTVFFLNIDCLHRAQKDARYASILNAADLLLPDGVGIQVLTRAAGGKMRDNCNGSDLSPKLMRLLAGAQHKIFLLGGNPGVAEKAAAALTEMIPGIGIAGVHDGYFDDTGKLIAEINASGAGILFVGMGVPLQEKFIMACRDTLQPHLCLGVGALFDYLSHRIPRAPVALRALHCEWIWRILMEPGRMIQRYILTDLPFILVLGLRLLKMRARPLAQPSAPGLPQRGIAR